MRRATGCAVPGRDRISGGDARLGATKPRPKRFSTRRSRRWEAQEKLSKAEAATWKAKAKITIEGNDSEVITEATVQGLDHFHSVFEGDLGGNKVKGESVLSGEKGWRKVGGQILELEPDTDQE